MNPFLYLVLLAGLIVVGVWLLSRGCKCPGCRTAARLDALDAVLIQGEREATAHTAAALRVVAGSNVVPMQRRASRWS